MQEIHALQMKDFDLFPYFQYVRGENDTCAECEKIDVALQTQLI